MQIFKPGAPFRKVDGGVRFDDPEKKFQFQFTLTEPSGIFITIEARALEPVGRHDSVKLGVNNEKPSYCSLQKMSTSRYLTNQVRSYNLPAGTLGVFMIIGIIIASTYAIAKLTAPKNNNK